MLEHVIKSVRDAGVDRIVVVVGHQGGLVQQRLGAQVEYVTQHEQLGTGHAVMQTAPLLRDHVGHILITYGDTPLYLPTTYQTFIETHLKNQASATVLSAHIDDPRGYGRIVRDPSSGQFQAIVEQKDITSETIERITEINTGTYCFASPLLFEMLTQINNDNQQGEYYLPDVLTLLVQQGHPVGIHVLDDPNEAKGINDRRQLAEAEAVINNRTLERMMESGVTIVDPRTTVIHPDVDISPDTVIYPFTAVRGKTVIGSGCQVGPHAVIDDSTLEEAVTVEGAVVKSSYIGKGSFVESFVSLRPGTRIEPGRHVLAPNARED